MLRTLSDELASAERLLAAITSSDVSARIAAYLLDLPGGIRDGVPTGVATVGEVRNRLLSGHHARNPEPTPCRSPPPVSSNSTGVKSRFSTLMGSNA
jgi:hypothetical protein